jgi:hypothetical protein
MHNLIQDSNNNVAKNGDRTMKEVTKKYIQNEAEKMTMEEIVIEHNRILEGAKLRMMFDKQQAIEEIKAAIIYDKVHGKKKRLKNG